MNSRYQPPNGDIYLKLKSAYGKAGADSVAIADASGEPYAINDAITALKYGDKKNDSAVSIFVDQVTTDPLAAPLESANDQIGKAVANVFKNPWVLIALAVFVAYQLGGFTWLRKQLA